MEKQVIEATERVIARVVKDFQSNPARYWNERDLHWSLFYYLKKEGRIQEKYTTEIIRAEFPTLKTFGTENPARGHFDLAILDHQSYRSPAVQNMSLNAPWQDFLELIKITVAIEIKLWLAKLRRDIADWDIKKLTEKPNNILNAYFLNFVQLDFSRLHSKKRYEELREYLRQKKRQHSRLKILCVPSDPKIQSDSSENWITGK